jgi:hypothetical protein
MTEEVRESAAEATTLRREHWQPPRHEMSSVQTQISIERPPPRTEHQYQSNDARKKTQHSLEQQAGHHHRPVMK